MNWLQNLQSFTQSLPETVQFLGVLLASIIPFVESYGAAMIGVIVGVGPWVSIPVAVAGNIVIVVAIVLLADRIRAFIIQRRTDRGRPPREETESGRKVRRAFDRYGVAGVSLLGPLLLPTHFLAAAMVSFGARRGVVAAWQSVGIAVYGVAFGLLAYAGLTALAG